jgi:hypothetical protein
MTRSTRAGWLVLVAVAGSCVSGYLAAFELGWVSSVWDPIFGSGSERVLSSGIATLLPVPDALLGAAAYVVDAALASLLAVGVARAQLVSGALAVISVVGAVIGIALAISQPLLVGTFCTLCLVSTLISIVLAAGAVAEALDAGSGARHRNEEVTP